MLCLVLIPMCVVCKKASKQSVVLKHIERFLTKQDKMSIYFEI